jgi:uncharacterized delta-60 repeat protein
MHDSGAFSPSGDSSARCASSPTGSRFLIALALVAVSLGTGACGKDEPSPTPSPDAGQTRPDAGSTAPDSGTGPDSGTEPLPDAGEQPPPAFTLTAATELTIAFNPTNNYGFVIQVQRQPDFTGEVSLSVEGLPEDVTTDPTMPLTIPGTEDSSSLFFALDEFTTYGRFPVKLVATGGGSRVEHTLTLVILHAQAALDSSFGTRGVAAPELGHPAVSINAMAVQPDGKWILVGSTGSTGLRDVLVARLLADGTPDTSFGTRGVVVQDICGSDDYVDAVTVLSDGRIVVAGGAVAGTNTCTGSKQQSALFARFTASGTPDTTFGGTGTRTFQLTSGIATLHAVTVDANGNVVGAGTVDNSDLDLLVIRLTPTGVPDTTFSSDGLAWTDEGGNEDGLGLVTESDGEVVVVGTSTNSSNTLAVVRFNANGTRDRSFSYIPSYVSPDIKPRTVHLLSNGRLLIGGRADFAEGDVSAALVRLTSNGDEDTTFNRRGYQYLSAGRTSRKDTVVGTALLPGGEIAVATWSLDAAGASGLGVIHMSADGATQLRSHRTDLPGEETPTTAVLDAEGYLRVAGMRTLTGQAGSKPFVTRFWPY